VATLADLLGDINALHPFREGNGRTQRAFLAQLARAAGHPIRWAAMDPQVNIVASQAARRGDHEPLAAMLDQLVDPGVAAASRPAVSPGPDRELDVCAARRRAESEPSQARLGGSAPAWR
jgi:cell filamentation protein